MKSAGKHIRLAGLHVALVAMLLRAFLPVGWMPAPPSQIADAEWVPFVICTGNGLVRLNAPAGSEHSDDKETITSRLVPMRPPPIFQHPLLAALLRSMRHVLLPSLRMAASMPPSFATSSSASVPAPLLI